MAGPWSLDKLAATSGEPEGRILKQIGDAFMLMFTQPADAVEFGLSMDRFVDAEPNFRRCTSAPITAPSCTARATTSAAQSISRRAWPRPVKPGSS